jgi:hypothetical protein
VGPPLKIQQKNSEGPLRRCDRSNVFAAQVRDRKLQSQICQSQKFTLRYNGEFGTCEIGKLIDVEAFSLFPRERQSSQALASKADHLLLHFSNFSPKAALS